MTTFPPEGKSANAITTLAWITIAVVIGIGGYILGSRVTHVAKEGEGKALKAGEPAKKEPPKPSKPDDISPAAIFKIPVTSADPAKGPAGAKITMVVFSEFQCPFCKRIGPTFEEIFKAYPNEVRLVWKNNPLSFHSNARDAAKASWAAHQQGKFWEYHDKLFENQKALAKDNLVSYAQELGLNPAKFQQDLDSPAAEAKIQEDAKLGEQIGARGTPNAFVNGRQITGARPFEQFKIVIDQELQRADAALGRGLARAVLYEELTKDGRTTPAEAARPVQAQVAENVKVDLGDAPAKGNKFARATLVIFSDFQCPYCSKVELTIKEVAKNYPNDVRLVFKNMPLSFHQYAHLAAQASLAAQAQGKFWEYQDKLFENQKALTKDDLISYAKDLGLNADKFRRELEDGKYKAAVDADIKQAGEVLVRGTPHFFINGRRLSGAQPYDKFKTMIDEEIAKAQKYLDQGIKPADLYSYIMDHLPRILPPAEAAAPGLGAAPTPEAAPVPIDVGDAPALGPPNAPVTIVEFSDFQCPFCGRGAGTVKELKREYGDKIRIAFKHQPLAMHNNAQLAAEAAMAAHEQGRFWDMHDKLFANQQNLSKENLIGYARELGLNLEKFKNALDSGKWRDLVKKNQEQAGKVGASGTPTFFINGRKITGAQPKENFKKIIDEELAQRR